jgi:high frequency lysogenization protein
MTEHRLRDRTIALAGVAQAARLIDQIAHTGKCPAEYLEASLFSLFSFDAPTSEEVFGTLQGVKLGLDTLAAEMADPSADFLSATRKHQDDIIKLEKYFRQRPDLQQTIRSRLEHAHYKAQHFSRNSHEIAANIAGIYQDTLSHLPFKIKVHGSAQHLQNERNAHLIRALLLAGVRAAFLWRQLGGSRLHRFTQRGAIADCAVNLVRHLEP